MKRAVMLLVLAGCDDSLVQRFEPDQCVRERLFQECLGRVPPGPSSTHYSGWEHVVSECASFAYYTSQRDSRTITPECGGDAARRSPKGGEHGE